MVRERLQPARARRGFTLVEVLIAAALLGFSLIVMFGFHAQAARSNLHARKITACTYLAQARMEELISLAWTETTGVPADLQTLGGDTTSASDPWVLLPHPAAASAVNAMGNAAAEHGVPEYWVTWASDYMDAAPTWLRIRVRCAYYDARFDTWRGTTISTYKYRDI